ncbi:hypothetical protein, partial [uncultured Muribaculum sp.]|uniref:hypothetical protein n=1 Tax=uncultured Muribaculum sp. TaxID=1918613 RepID=UPI00272FD415
MVLAVDEVCTIFFEALMMPCARLPGSETTHCAFAVSPANDRAAHTISDLIFMFLKFLLVNKSVIFMSFRNLDCV